MIYLTLKEVFFYTMTKILAAIGPESDKLIKDLLFILKKKLIFVRPKWKS